MGAEVAELADAADLKSAEDTLHAGSNPAFGSIINKKCRGVEQW